MLGKVSACHLISQARKASKLLILLLKGLIPPFLLKNIYFNSNTCFSTVSQLFGNSWAAISQSNSCNTVSKGRYKAFQRQDHRTKKTPILRPRKAPLREACANKLFPCARLAPHTKIAKKQPREAIPKEP